MSGERIIPNEYGDLLMIASNRAMGVGFARVRGDGRLRTLVELDLDRGNEWLGRMEHAGLVTGIAWSPDGTRILTIGDDGIARIWWSGPTCSEGELISRSAEITEEVKNGAPVQEELLENVWITDQDRRAHRITLTETITPDTVQLSQPFRNDLAKVPIAASGDCTRFLFLAEGGAIRAFRSADGCWLVTSACGGERDPATAIVWNLASGKRTGVIVTEMQVQDAAFAAAPAQFALASGFHMDGVVQLFSVKDARPLAPQIHGPGKPLRVCFAPDAQRLAVSFGNGGEAEGSQIGVFDALTGTELVEPRLEGPTDGTFRFVSEGHRLATTIFSTERHHDVPSPTGKAPKWLPELARIIARRELNPAGLVVRIRDVASRRAKLELALKDAPSTPVKTIAAWLLKAPGERPVSPASQEMHRAQMEAEIARWRKERLSQKNGESEETPDLESLLNALDLAHALRASAFGDKALLASIEAQCKPVRAKLLSDFSAELANIEKESEVDANKLAPLAIGLRRLCKSAPGDLAFASQVNALLSRGTARLAKAPKAAPPKRAVN